MEFIGVKNFSELLTASLEGEQILKREALIFDRIGISEVDQFGNDKTLAARFKANWADLKWLRNKGIVFDPKDEMRGKQPVKTEAVERLHQEYHAHDKILSEMAWIKRRTEKVQTRFLIHAAHTFRMDTILTSFQLRHACGLDAYPVFYQSSALPELNVPTHDVVQVVLNVLPIPDEVTSWEQINEFRVDPDTRSKFLDLRNWMHEIARAELTPIEVEQKLEHLIDLYERHMKLHKMKASSGVLETVITSTAELLEDVIKFKWGDLAKNLFSLRQRKIALMEGELTAPGKEIAYIIKARKTF